MAESSGKISALDNSDSDQMDVDGESSSEVVRMPKKK
jgi:hypothetical protein